MAFLNRIRLPLRTFRPQFPEEREVFRKADGTSKTISAVIRKTYQLETGFLPEGLHEKLKVALAHDQVSIENDKLLSGITQDGAYTIDWPEFLDYPLAKATTVIQVTPFNATKNNCQTCEEVNQVNLEDDFFEETLEENGEYSIDVSENDTICCYPAEFSLVNFNTAYVVSAIINPTTGLLSITLGFDLVASNNVKLATYRVTCPNGGYDEADVYGAVNGTQVGCMGPENLEAINIQPSQATLSWNLPTPVPDEFYVEVFAADDLVTPVFTQGGIPNTDDPTEVIVTGLDPDTDYIAFVYGLAGSYCTSDPVQVEFTTLVQSATCGRYLVTMDDGTGDRTHTATVSYRNCEGIITSVPIFNTQSRFICALQNSPGDPVSITPSSGSVTYEYVTEC